MLILNTLKLASVTKCRFTYAGMLNMLEDFIALLLLLLRLPSGTTVPLSSFYSYGSAAGDTLLPPNDDGSSPSITLPAPFLFYGINDSTIFVSWFSTLTFKR